MAHIFRWLMRLFLVLAVLAGCIIVVIYNLAARSLPDYDAAFVVEDIESPVEIVRDNANIPHIFAETDPDVLFGLGFAHAQDRLWQMTLMRRTAQGRLSELLGEPTVKTDELMRRFGLYRAAESSVEVQDPQVMEALKAYSAGVNAWIETVNSEALGRGAPEFFMFSPEIAPWRPADSIALMKLMAYQLSSHLQAE
ncbi:MAG: penicillin acylase family protein, partial [Pseudomonadota bacterium]